MRVVITGGAGFLGRRLARRVLERGRLAGPSGEPASVREVVLLDRAAAEGLPADGRLRAVAGDVGDRALLDELVAGAPGGVSVFHLASMVSAGCEADFDGALRVNLDGGRAVLEACRRAAGRPRLVFASSLAVYGGPDLPTPVDEATRPTPETTYGMTKVAMELLVADYSRRGFLDGRSARLPTVIVRPGRPNRAASGFASGVFREPLNGETAVVPVPPETAMPVIGARTAVEGLLRLHDVPGEALGPARTLNLPSLAPTVAEMVACLRRVAGDRPLGAVEYAPDPGVEAIVRTWPRAIDGGRAAALGLPADPDLESILRAYIEDDLS